MKKILIILFIIVLCLVPISVYLVFKNNKFENLTVDQKVERKLKEMTINEKIAQMLIVYYTSDTVDENLINTLNKNAFGGFILMKDNITSYEKTRKFVTDLQENSDIPLIISIDEEGGNVQRLEYLTDVKATDVPSMYYLGKTEDEKLSYQVGKLLAEELKTIGVNVDFAPVIDIYSNPNNKVIGKRSFGNDYNLVSKMANSLANGLEDNGVIAVYKHFPGHGDTETDSHIDLPVINKTKEELYELELKPFESAIKNGAKMIMIGHIALPNITNDNTPASLSKVLITDILKNEMGYDGLVITDALNMGAITNYYSYEEMYTKAVDAGADLLLMPEGSKDAINYIKKNITEERIDESVRKILKFKYTYLDNSFLDKEYLGSKEHLDIISNINTEE